MRGKTFPLDELKEMIFVIFDKFKSDGYLDEHIYSMDWREIELHILLQTRNKNLWPVDEKISSYSEEDLFDAIEFLYLNISKPIDGHEDYGNWDWDTFSKSEGQTEFVQKINKILDVYEKPFELSSEGQILIKTEEGFDQMFKADIPTDNNDVKHRISSAIKLYRKYRSTLDDRRQAVRDLVDVLEFLRPNVKDLLTQKDENDLFNIANNFGIRHMNDRQKTNYDKSIWLSWMFYFYLSTVHVVLRKIKKEQTEQMHTD